MDSIRRKELKNTYKDQAAVGGIYCIRCKGNGRTWVKSTTNLEGQNNRFAFSVSTNSCPEPAMQTEWREYGAQSFSMEILEELKQKETQTGPEFSRDIKTLLELWQEKYRQEGIPHGTDHWDQTIS